MAVALHTDVATALGHPITDADQIAQVDWWIAGAELQITRRLGDPTALDAAAVRYVVAEAVARRVRNPDGKQNERIDDYSYGRTPEAAAGEVTITEAEWALLTPATATPTGAFSVRPTFTTDQPPAEVW